MTKRTYKTQKFQTFKRHEELRGKAIVVGIDVAKKKIFAAIALKENAQHPIATVTFNQPKDLRLFVDWLAALPSSSTDVALESSGTYGDSLRHLLQEAGIHRPYRSFSSTQNEFTTGGRHLTAPQACTMRRPRTSLDSCTAKVSRRHGRQKT